MKAHVLYVYGTLQVPAIIQQIVGRALRAEPATLEGYARYRVQGRVYPAIVEHVGGRVEGLVYDGLSSPELEHLDLYEGALYERRVVDVSKKGVFIQANAYVLRASQHHLLSPDSWELETFTRDHLEDYLSQISVTSRAP
jgi:gamma-glutamylcyclotransferase (GGCT)/AIG2-like uncharacterized protein YtfP